MSNVGTGFTVWSLIIISENIMMSPACIHLTVIIMVSVKMVWNCVGSSV